MALLCEVLGEAALELDLPFSSSEQVDGRPAAGPPGGWHMAFQAIRSRNEELEQRHRKMQAAAAALEASKENTASGLATGVATGAGAAAQPAAAKAVVMASPEVSSDMATAAVASAPKAGSSSSKRNGSTDDEEFEVPKVLSTIDIWALDIEDEDLATRALDLTLRTDVPALAVLFNVPTIEREGLDLPRSRRLREILELDDADIRSLFRVEEVTSYGERACEFRGRLRGDRQASPAFEGQPLGAEEVTALLARFRKRLKEAGAPQAEVFLQSDEETNEAILMVFVCEDLPDFQPSGASRQLAGILAGTTLACLNAPLFASLAEGEGALPENWYFGALSSLGAAAGSATWSIGPLIGTVLVASMAARHVVASFHDVRISSFPLPSLNAGALGSTWRPRGFLPSQRARLDIAASAPATTFLLSLALVAEGVLQVQGLDAAEAPLQIAAIQLPFILASLLGFKAPPGVGEEPLLTLTSGDISNLVSTQEAYLSPLPANVFLLSGAVGLTMAAVSLIPMSGFDGHAVARAAFGRKAASLLELASLGALFAEATRDDFRGEFAGEVLVLWLLMNVGTEPMPPLESTSEPGPLRQVLAALLLLTSAAVLFPPVPS